MSRRSELSSAPHRPTSFSAPRGLVVASILLVGGLVLTACGGAGIPESSQPSATTDASVPSTSQPTPANPAVLVPDGTAEGNLPVFAAVVAEVAAGPDNVSGRAYIDALVAAGFDKMAMQVTPDLTTIGNAAEAIQFSVRWQDQCLLGQVGPATGTPVATVGPVLGESCLVGATRAIDW